MNEGYRRITTANERDRQETFVSTARRVGITEQSVEKDFWVCWTIDALFHGRRENASRLLFKGGTSLSKAFGLIRRFSEDIDITVFRHDLGEPVSIEDLEKLSAKKRNAKLDEIRAACQQYLREELRPELETLLFQAVGDNRDERYSVTLDDTDPDGQTLLVRYPPALAACILGREQRANHACGFGRSEVRAGERFQRDRRATGPVDQQNSRDLQATVAGEVVPTPAVLLTPRCHAERHAGHSEHPHGDDVPAS